MDQVCHVTNVTSAGWQVTLVIPYGMQVPIAVRLVANCYTPFTFLPVPSMAQNACSPTTLSNSLEHFTLTQSLTHCLWRTAWVWCWNDASSAQTHVSAAQSPVMMPLASSSFTGNYRCHYSPEPMDVALSMPWHCELWQLLNCLARVMDCRRNFDVWWKD